MQTISFKNFIEAVDIFGFEKDKELEDRYNELDNYPIRQFNVELMMKLLNRKRIGLHEANYEGFMNEITWAGGRPGAIKLEVDTGFTFHIKRFNFDLEGQKRWVTKKLFQLNRKGLAGYEDIIANEIHDHIGRIYDQEIDYPTSEYNDLEKLTWKVSQTMKKVGKEIFLFHGIKKLDENCYHILFELRAGGVEAQDQQRVEQNVTQISFDEHTGTIRINNYNIESPTGGDRKWEVMPQDIDMYFFPSQSIDEIKDTVAVHFKYY